MDIGQLIVIGLSIVLLIWYFGASVYNRRRGQTLGRWLQAGLKSLGGQAGYKWIGSSASGLQAIVSGALPPWKSAEAIVLLETRELLPLWVFQRLTGRRDQLILKLTLRHRLTGSLDAAPRVVPPAGWTPTAGPHGLHLTTDRAGAALVGRLTPFLDRYGPALRSFSVRPQEPQLILALNTALIEAKPLEELLSQLAELQL
ncbi:MAG: hypothetical protein KIT87_16090 [Anaerolineae bacterium]|nr:hypothetical protein [Anaerolineae bacterium]